MIKLLSLKLKNWRSWKSLSLSFNEEGLWLISGKNGSGKTSIRQAIEYLFTDSTSENIAVDELSFNQEGNCEISCILEKDNNVIEIIKYREHKEFGNKTILLINDGDSSDDSLTHTDRRETQKEILNLLRTTKNSLFTSTIFSQNSLSFPEMRDKDRKSILYSFLDLDKYDSYQEKADKKYKEIVLSIKENQEIISRIEYSLENFKEDIKFNEEGLKDFDSNRQEKITELLIKKGNLEIVNYAKLEKKINKIKDNFRIVNNNYYKRMLKIKDGVNNKISSVSTTLRFIQNQIDENNDVIITNNNYYERIVRIKDGFIKKISSTRATLSFMGNQINEVGNNICPIFEDSCDRLKERKEEAENKYNKKINKYNRILLILLSNKHKVEVIIERIKKERKVEVENEYNKKIERYSRILSILQSNKYGINKIIEKIEEDRSINTSINDKISSIKYTIQSIKDENNRIEEKKDDIDNRVKEINNEKTPHKEIILNITNKIKKLKKDLKSTNKTIVKLEDLALYYKFWVVGYSRQGIPNLRIELILGNVEDKINENLAKVYKQAIVKLDAQRDLRSGASKEEIGYKVVHPEKTVTNYFSYSGGERQRVKIADLFAFSDLFNPFGFVFLDECLELSLDQMGINQIISLLKEKASIIGNIFVVSHNSDIKEKFDRIINIKKINGVSYIDE